MTISVVFSSVYRLFGRPRPRVESEMPAMMGASDTELAHRIERGARTIDDVRYQALALFYGADR